MARPRDTTAIVATLLLAACAGSPPPGAGPAPGRVLPVGTYRHAFTELALPPQLGSFERLYVTEYDPEKANVSGHYQDDAIPSAATVYHYPANATVTPPTNEEFVAHFAQTMQDIEGANATAERVSMASVEATINGFRLTGAHARFRLPEHPAFYGPADSHLYLFALDGWYLKFRFSHPDHTAGVAIEEERKLIQRIEWPIPE